MNILVKIVARIIIVTALPVKWLCEFYEKVDKEVNVYFYDREWERRNKIKK